MVMLSKIIINQTRKILIKFKAAAAKFLTVLYRYHYVVPFTIYPRKSIILGVNVLLGRFVLPACLSCLPHKNVTSVKNFVSKLFINLVNTFIVVSVNLPCVQDVLSLFLSCRYLLINSCAVSFLQCVFQ